jgi:hypothetical protein
MNRALLAIKTFTLKKGSNPARNQSSHQRTIALQRPGYRQLLHPAYTAINQPDSSEKWEVRGAQLQPHCVKQPLIANSQR